MKMHSSSLHPAKFPEGSYWKEAVQGEKLASRIFFGVTFLFVVFIMVVSWIPNWHDTQRLKQRDQLSFENMPTLNEIYQVHDLRDITTNVLLYIPLGVFFALALAHRKSYLNIPALLAGLLVSPLMEVGQGYIGRYSDPVDVVTNSTGYLLGYFLVMFAVRKFGFRPAMLVGIDSSATEDWRWRALGALQFLYVCVYIIVALLPFDISVSLTDIYAKLIADKNGVLKIIIDPLYHYHHWPQGAGKLFIELLGLVPIGIITALRDSLKHRLNWAGPVVACISLALVCETQQLFVHSRSSDVILFPLSILAGTIGWGLTKTWLDFQHLYEGHSVTSPAQQRNLVFIALSVYVFFVCLFCWAPFQFEFDLRELIYKLRYATNWLPFKEHIKVRGLGSALDLVKDTGIYIPFGVLLAYFSQSDQRVKTKRIQTVALVTLFGLLLGAFIEMTQLACVGRYPDITDIFLAGLGTLMGAGGFRLFLRNQTALETQVK